MYIYHTCMYITPTMIYKFHMFGIEQKSFENVFLRKQCFFTLAQVDASSFWCSPFCLASLHDWLKISHMAWSVVWLQKSSMVSVNRMEENITSGHRSDRRTQKRPQRYEKPFVFAEPPSRNTIWNKLIPKVWEKNVYISMCLKLFRCITLFT